MLSSSSDPSHRLPEASRPVARFSGVACPPHVLDPLSRAAVCQTCFGTLRVLTTLCPDSGSECTPEHGVLCKTKHGAVHCWCAAGAEKAERRYFCVVQFQVCTVSLGIGSHILQRGEVHVARVILSIDCFFRRFKLRISWALLQIR